jgi:cytochrome c-type biogenesis protein CcmH
MRSFWGIVCIVAALVACSKPEPEPPAGARPAARGLPPAEAGGGAQPAGHPALPAGHPDLPAGHPPIGAAPAAAGGGIEGTIDVAPELKDQVKAGDIVFLTARSVDASGAVVRMPVAVDKVTIDKLPMAFRLTSANVMVAGTPFAGAMVVTARIDRDGEAMTRTAGDIEGTQKVQIPASGVKITLDTPVKP